GAVNGGVAVDRLDRHRLAIDPDARPLAPTGDAEFHVERLLGLRIDGDGDVAAPRVVRDLADIDLRAADIKRGRDAAIEVEGEPVGRGGDEIATDRRHEAGHVHGAARAGVPLPAGGGAVALERVHVEIVLAVAAEACERAVV